MAVTPTYKYGKVTGLYPDLTVVSERGESPMVCCGWCSAQMACRCAKAGVTAQMTNEAHAMRKASGRPHPAGARASELRAGALKAVGVGLTSVKVANILTRLEKGFAVVINMDYAKLPGYLKVQSNSFGHSATLFGYRKSGLTKYVGFYDPLWSQGTRGAWAKWSDIKPALWSDGNHSTTIVRLEPVAGDYVVYEDQASSLKTGKIAGNTPFFNDWRMDSQRGKFGSAGGTVQIMGYRGDSYAVKVKTAQGWSDGKSRPTLVFVPKTAISGIVDAPPPVTDCTDAVLEARREEYDRVTAFLPPRP